MMKKLAPFLVLLAGILWGIIGLFIRKLNILGFASMDIVFLRAVTTSALLGLFLLIFDKEKLRIHIRDIWCFFGTAILSIVFFNFCYFKAITLTSLSVAAILLYTAPAVVMILSALLFHEKITPIKILSLALTIAGCVFVTGVTGVLFGGGTLNIQGILTGLGAGFGYALYSIFGRYALERGYHSLTISFYTFLFAAIGTIPFANYSTLVVVCKSDFGTIPYIFLFGLVSTVLPYIAYTRGLQEMENSNASIIASIEPVTATLIGLTVYHEALSGLEIVGVVMVIGAIILNNIGGREKYDSINVMLYKK